MMHIVYFGMPGTFSVPPLRALLDAAINVCAVVVPAVLPGTAPIALLAPPHRPADMLCLHAPSEQSIAQIAWARNIPVFELRHPNAPEVRATLSKLNPDVGCVACFSQRLPATLLALPPHGFLNVHPSLLPHGRGPEPLFWTFRNGEPGGVSVHAMNEQLDAGDIVAQAAVELLDGISGIAAEHHCATIGGALLVDALHALACGTGIRHPQPPGGSYNPSPTTADFAISATWSAQRVFNFMRGTAEWGVPYTIEVGGVQIALQSALEYSTDAVLKAPSMQQGDDVVIQCAPGIVRALLA